MSCFKSEIAVIFILGGPGSGKGTQCQRAASIDTGSSTPMRRYVPLSVGDVLRNEMNNPESKYGSIIADNMKNGRVGPMRITVELLRLAMIKSMTIGLADGLLTSKPIFLIDGFPRKLDQALLFEAEISSPFGVVIFDCPEHTLKQRLQERSAALGRFDDNDDTIKKRIATFHETTKIVIDHYRNQGLTHQIDATGSIEEVSEKFVSVLDSILTDIKP